VSLFNPAALRRAIERRQIELTAVAYGSAIRVDLLTRYLNAQTLPSRQNLERIARTVQVELVDLLFDVSQVPGEAVAQLRELNGWSQQTLANSMRNLTLRTLQRIEAGEAPIGAEEHKRLAAALATDGLSLPDHDQAMGA